MAKYLFSISTDEGTRRVGVVQSDNFEGAMSVLESQVQAGAGDTLEIGVPGFPPARYQAVSMEGSPLAWRPQGLLAA